MADDLAVAGRISIAENFHVAVNEFLPCAWCSIFNTAEFFRLHRHGTGFYFQLLHRSHPEVVAIAHFTEDSDGCFKSPRRGTFGGFEFSGDLPFAVSEEFIIAVERYLQNLGAREIRIAAPPGYLSSWEPSWTTNVLLRNNYQLALPEVDCFIKIDDEPLRSKMGSTRRKIVSRCDRQGIHCRLLAPDLFQTAYEVIVTNRQSRGFPVTMAYNALLEMVETFPERVIFFGAFAGTEMIASSVCIRLLPEALYVFYWGDLPQWSKVSPVTYLAAFIYDHARRVGCRWLDLGTSTVGGIPNYGLLRFKRELGSGTALKMTFTKHFKHTTI
jgi:hypothetical protein